MSTATSVVKAEQKPASAKKTFQELVDGAQFKSQIAAALPKHLTVDRFIRVLMTATLKNPKLLECTQESLFKGIFDCAAIGLELDGRRAHLVPLKNTKKGVLEANLWLDYKGIAELAMRSGVISNIHADIVCENDTFEVDRGEIKKHAVNYRKERGEMYAAYCIIRMKDGGEKCEVMSCIEIDRVRDRSPGKNEDPWTKHYAEQAKKTVFKRAAKWVPWSAEQADVLERDGDRLPELNVTPRPAPTMAQILGGDENAKPGPDIRHQPGDSKPALPSDPAARAEAPVEYTDAQREEFIKAIENHILDAKVSEKSFRVELSEANIATDEEFSLTEQPTAVLAEVAGYCAEKKGVPA